LRGCGRDDKRRKDGMVMDKELKDIDLSENKSDDLASILRGAAGTVPWIGSFVAELITTIIPNQRMDRFSEYLKILSKKLSTIEEHVVKTKLQDNGFVSLFEESLYSAVRATTQERKEHIASIVKNSITDETADYIRYKYLLSLLSELNDVEVILLQSYATHNDEEFHEKHKDILTKPLLSEDVNIRVVHENYKDHLARLRLLRPRFKRPRKDEYPEFDEKTGMIKAQGYELASLGRILLQHIDLIDGF
jgi:hypothetical protein